MLFCYLLSFCFQAGNECKYRHLGAHNIQRRALNYWELVLWLKLVFGRFLVLFRWIEGREVVEAV